MMQLLLNDFFWHASLDNETVMLQLPRLTINVILLLAICNWLKKSSVDPFDCLVAHLSPFTWEARKKKTSAQSNLKAPKMVH